MCVFVCVYVCVCVCVLRWGWGVGIRVDDEHVFSCDQLLSSELFAVCF